MKIWINNPFDALPMEGGRPMRYELLTRALVELGHDVVWWSSDFHHQRKEKRALEPIYRSCGFEVRLIPTLPYHSNVGWRRLRSHSQYALKWQQMAFAALAAKELQPPDAIILSMPPLGLFDRAIKLRDEYGCKIVIDIQDAWPENFVNLIPLSIRSLVGWLMFPFKKVAERAYRGADVITAVADKYLRLAETYGAVSPSKAFALGGILPDISGPADTSDQCLKLVYVGNLGPSYDLKTMFSAISELVAEGVALTLDIAGDGPRRTEVEAAVKLSGGAIRFHGYLPGDQLTLLMNRCDIGIIPMKDEMLVAVPNKLVDYAAHGLAVLNGLTSETKDFLEDYECGVLYEIGSVESFKHATRLYLENRELLKAHKLNSRRMAEQNFDAAKISVAMACFIAGEASD